jgi:hypothetical protein
MTDMIVVPFEYVGSREKMKRIADEMIAFAKANPFCHKEMMDVAEADPTLKKEKVGPMLRIRGKKDVMEKYNRFIAFTHKGNGKMQAIQTSYTIAEDPEIQGIRQLTLVESLKQPLEEDLVMFIAGYFFDNAEGTVMRMTNTPPHVCVLVQKPEPHDPHSVQ